MKKAFMILVMLLMVTLSMFSFAEDTTTGIINVLDTAGIQNPIQLSQWGDTAACFAKTDGVKRLIVLEKQNNGWQIVVNNPTALMQDRDLPQLLLDSDNAVFWTYTLSEQEIVRYHASRSTDGTWSPVDQYFSDSGFGEYTYVWSTMWDDANGGEIIRTFGMYDENDNDHGIQLMEVLPATWMADCVRLEDFDVSRFPTFIESTDHYAYENECFFREAAAALMPGYTFVKGMLKGDAMHFLMEKPDGSRVYVICEYMSHREVRLIESTPLPEGTVLGYENFTDSLWIGNRCVTVQLLYNGDAGLEYIYDDAAYSEGSGGFLFFGDRTVWDGSAAAAQTIILYGDHPWDNITQIDWNALPHSLDEASAQMDSGNYAMVLNPNPADRLHLRERADKGSRSQGKYYTGTPVGVSEQDGDWTLVTFGDWRSWVHGYMMRRYLTFGQSGSALRLDFSAMPQLSADGVMLKVYQETQNGAYTYHMNADQNTMKVIGIIGNDWYHVWFPATGEYGFVRQSDLWPGNG